MKSYKVIIPYTENKKSGTVYKVDFEILADNKPEAIEKALKKFEKFLDFNMASWIRIPIEKDIQVKFIKEIKEPEPWSYL
ncbi:MAG: hypothetical protein ACQESP_02885 [Candidatus Muiribacteriota bacterium]